MALTAETESRLYRSLRVAAGAAAHLVALGFPAAVAVLARPGSSECRWGRGRGEGRMSELTSPCASLPGLFSWHPLLMALAVSAGPPPRSPPRCLGQAGAVPAESPGGGCPAPAAPGDGRLSPRAVGAGPRKAPGRGTFGQYQSRCPLPPSSRS